jgi:glutathione S-transferase
MIRLHHCHQARSARVLWMLEEIGCDYELVVHAFDASLRDPGYLAKNPVGRVPALEIDGETWFESLAILELLSERFPQAGLGRAAGSPERAEFLIWLHFSETMAVQVQALTLQHIRLFEDWMRSPVLMKLEARRLAVCFRALEAHLSDGREWVLRGGFSAADIALGYAVDIGRRFARIDGFPALTNWLGRATARPGFAATVPPEGAELIYARDFYEVPDG